MRSEGFYRVGSLSLNYLENGKAYGKMVQLSLETFLASVNI
jgi:hypothetical protein